MARLSPVLALLCLVHLSACGDDDVELDTEVENVEVPALITELPGTDVEVLTGPGDRRMWEQLVNDLLSPCGDPISIAQCVSTEGSCNACRPAANYVARLVAEGLDRGDVRELYRARYSGEPLDIPIEGAPVKGARMGAAVTIVEFSDFECPYCGLATPIIRSLVSEFEGQVRIVFKHYPLSGHENAIPAAKAAIAAMRQGKFWEMHDLLFAHQEELQASDFDRYAAEIGLDLERFHDDMENPETGALVELNRSEGRRIGVEGTPSIYINGRKFEEPFENLSSYIREEIDARE